MRRKVKNEICPRDRCNAEYSKHGTGETSKTKQPKRWRQDTKCVQQRVTNTMNEWKAPETERYLISCRGLCHQWFRDRCCYRFCCRFWAVLPLNEVILLPVPPCKRNRRWAGIGWQLCWIKRTLICHLGSCCDSEIKATRSVPQCSNASLRTAESWIGCFTMR